MLAKLFLLSVPTHLTMVTLHHCIKSHVVGDNLHACTHTNLYDVMSTLHSIPVHVPYIDKLQGMMTVVEDCRD